MASNAASIAWSARERAAPASVMSTKVPSSGRARRRLSEAVCIERQYPLYALGHMVRGQGRAGNVADVLVHREGIGAGLADELGEPARAPDFASVRFPVLQDLHAMHLAARIERHRIVDEEMLADHSVEDEEA